MPTLPQFQDDDRTFQLMQNQWGALINPFLNNPANNSLILKNVVLLAASNPNVVNHLLGRKLQGWKLIRVRAQATVWDTQDSNQMPSLTLYLKTSADVVVDIECF